MATANHWASFRLSILLLLFTTICGAAWVVSTDRQLALARDRFHDCNRRWSESVLSGRKLAAETEQICLASKQLMGAQTRARFSRRSAFRASHQSRLEMLKRIVKSRYGTSRDEIMQIIRKHEVR